MIKFKLWKENKIDQEYEMTLEEIKAAYDKFCQRKVEADDVSWLIYYGHQTVNHFIGASEEEGGLNSVVEFEDYEPLQEALAKTRYKYIPKQKS